MSAGEDTLSRVVLSVSAAQRWLALAPQIAALAGQHGVSSPDQIPDELAREQPDGSLLIYVQMPDGTVHGMRAEPHEWDWAGSRNQ